MVREKLWALGQKIIATSIAELRKKSANSLLPLQKQISSMELPPIVRQSAKKELERLQAIPVAATEYTITLNYLQWLLALPWRRASGKIIDVVKARQILDEDHYNLTKIKERIIEHLSVTKLRAERQTASKMIAISDTRAAIDPKTQLSAIPNVPNIYLETPADLAAREPVLCLVGPSGVGKTSLGQSIARALGRKFIYLNLGGISAADIQGQRRTDMGALPGRIIQSLKRAGVNDPVILLDAVDKVSVSLREDHFSSLLEVLDPSQNYHFIDHYLGVPFDLSCVLFIVTANTLDTIPTPVLNLMEVLRISGYTDAEKVRIAELYLVPKQRVAHGLTEQDITLDAATLHYLIRSYTREAGVRQLNYQIATLCRKIAYQIVTAAAPPQPITSAQLHQLLGPIYFFDEAAERITKPGIATGLVWTAAGGELLFIEATMMSSHQERLILTGMLGESMRESAEAALSYVRAHLTAFDLPSDLLDNKTVHIHIPEGAMPKDGPSAGVTLVVALTSLVTQRLVHNDVAMTGEITLRGKILPVGGVKEKILAAHRAGIEKVILPLPNETDLEEIPAELRQKMQFIFVKSLEEVFAWVLGARSYE